MNNDPPTGAVTSCLDAFLTSAIGTSVDLTDPSVRAGTVWNLGLTSAGFIALLTWAEDGFGFEWDLDESVDALATVDLLVASITRNATRMPDDHARQASASSAAVGSW